MIWSKSDHIMNEILSLLQTSWGYPSLSGWNLKHEKYVWFGSKFINQRQGLFQVLTIKFLFPNSKWVKTCTFTYLPQFAFAFSHFSSPRSTFLCSHSSTHPYSCSTLHSMHSPISCEQISIPQPSYPSPAVLILQQLHYSH